MPYVGKKATNVVDVSETQSLTVDGDLTVDTDTLVVDSTNNRVGIGTASPNTLTTLSANSGNAILELNRANANTTGAVGAVNFTVSDGHSVANMYAQGDGDNEGAHLVFRTTSAAGENDPYGSNTTERMRIDSSGNVGIGSTSPHSELDVRGAGEIFTVQGDGGASAEMNLSLINGTGNKSTIINFGKNLGTSDRYLGRIIYEVDNNNMDFYTSGTFRARFTSAGNLAIGATTTSNKLEVRGVGLFSSDGNYRGSNSGILNVSPNGNLAIGFGGDTDANYYAAIFHNASNTAVGSIFVDASSTTYATSSDYRLKENVAVLTGAIERVKALAPKRFNFIAEPDRTMDGFLAHEAAAVVPEAVQGEKDAMSDQQFMVTPALGDIITPATDDADEVVHSTGVVKPDTLEDGQEWRQTASPIMETRSAPDYQGIDQAKLVPLLTAALQEAIAKIETLETKVAALEAE